MKYYPSVYNCIHICKDNTFLLHSTLAYVATERKHKNRRANPEALSELDTIETAAKIMLRFASKSTPPPSL